MVRIAPFALSLALAPGLTDGCDNEQKSEDYKEVLTSSRIGDYTGDGADDIMVYVIQGDHVQEFGKYLYIADGKGGYTKAIGDTKFGRPEEADRIISGSYATDNGIIYIFDRERGFFAPLPKVKPDQR